MCGIGAGEAVGGGVEVQVCTRGVAGPTWYTGSSTSSSRMVCATAGGGERGWFKMSWLQGSQIHSVIRIREGKREGERGSLEEHLEKQGRRKTSQGPRGGTTRQSNVINTTISAPDASTLNV